MFSDPQKIHDLFVEALQYESAKREDFLQAHCGPDSELRREVLVLLLLDEREQAEGRLQTGQLKIGSSPSDPIVGQRIEEYEIVRRIGTGGGGTVYEARRVYPYKQRVAIKLLSTEPATREHLLRFARERQILARLRHPNIVRLLDGGQMEGTPYLVMEYVEGQPLSKYCDCHHLDVRKRLDVFRVVCTAVQFAHHLTIHRDLKPNNILVTEEGTPILLDFGIATIINPDMGFLTAFRTQTPSFIGTRPYASPEQLGGETVTTLSDVYSLGVILYELLTGHLPGEASRRQFKKTAAVAAEPTTPSAAVLRPVECVLPNGTQQVITPDAIAKSRSASSPQHLSRCLRGDLDSIALKALRQEPYERYSSAQELSQDLQRYLRGQPVLASNRTWAYRWKKFVGRHRRSLALVILLSFILCASLASIAYQQIHVMRTSYTAKMNQRLADWENQYRGCLHLAALSVGTRRDYPQRSLLLAMEAAQVSKELHTRIPEVEQTLIDSIEACGGNPISGHGGNTQVTFSRDGSRLCAWSPEDAFVSLLDMRLLRPTFDAARLDTPCRIYDASLSPTGRWLAAGGEGHDVVLWDCERSNPSLRPLLLPASGGRISSLVFSDDGRWLLSAGSNGTARLWQFGPDGPLRDTVLPVCSPGPCYSSIAMTSDSRWAITYAVEVGRDAYPAPGSLRLWDLHAPDPSQSPAHWPTAKMPFGAILPGNILLSADGHWLLFADNTDRLVLLDLTSSAPLEKPLLLDTPGDHYRTAIFSDDSSVLACSTLDGIPRIWLLSHEGVPRMLSPSGITDAAATCIAISPDSRMLALPRRTLQQEIGLWTLPRMGAPHLVGYLKGHVSSVCDLRFTLDGKRLISASADRTIRVWTVREPIGESSCVSLTGHEAGVGTLVQSPDGRWFASCGGDNMPRLWNLSSLRGMSTPPVVGEGDGRIIALQFSPDDQQLISAHANGLVCVWDCNAADTLPRLARQVQDARLGSHSTVIAPDCSWCASTTGTDATIQIYSLAADYVWPLRCASCAPHTAPMSVLITADSRSLLVAGSNGIVEVWDVGSSEPARTLIADCGESLCSVKAMTVDHSRIVSLACGGHVAVRQVVTAHNGAVDLTVCKQWKDAIDVAISNDAQWVCIVSADGRIDLSRIDGTEVLRSPVRPFTGPDDCLCVAVSPDGQWIVAANNRLELCAAHWKGGGVESDTVRTVIADRFAGNGPRMVISPDGREVAIPTWDAVYVWGYRDLLQENRVLKIPTDTASACVAFSHNSRCLAVGHDDGVVRVWSLELDELLKRASRSAGRNLTPSEWNTYCGGRGYRKTIPELPKPHQRRRSR